MPGFPGKQLPVPRQASRAVSSACTGRHPVPAGRFARRHRRACRITGARRASVRHHRPGLTRPDQRAAARVCAIGALAPPATIAPLRKVAIAPCGAVTQQAFFAISSRSAMLIRSNTRPAAVAAVNAQARRRLPRTAWWGAPLLVAALTVGFAAAPPAQAAQPGVTQISSDPYPADSAPAAAHATEVEPDTFAHGSTVVTAFQVGRVFNGGASDIGWATS